MIRATAARAQGFIDQLVDSEGALRWASRKAVMQKRKSKPKRGFAGLLAKWPARGFLAGKMREETKKKVREDHYPAPFQLIELFEKHGGSYAEMKRQETAAFAPLMVSDTSRNLRRVFFLSEALKAQAPKDIDWKPVRVHVIGAGTMGGGYRWMVRCQRHGGYASGSLGRADRKGRGGHRRSSLRRSSERSRNRRRRGARLIADPDGLGVARADVVIEAIVEKLEVKQVAVQGLGGEAEARRCHGDEHIIVEDRRYRGTVGRSGPVDRHPLFSTRWPKCRSSKW